MHPFSFATTAQLICEPGSSRRLASLCKERGARSVLVVTDPGITRFGLLDEVLPGFETEGLQVAVYDQVVADPPEHIVLAAVAQARASRVDLIIGFGGGSSMDVAKLVALLADPDCAQSLQDIYGVGNAKGQRLPLIQVPTTAGTGSEVTWVSVITCESLEKKAVYAPQLLPDLALLDAGLSAGMPPRVTAATALDAMVHAIEAYTSRTKKNPVADALARKALALLAGKLPRVLEDGGDLEARAAVLEGAMLAGMAFVNASVAAIHGLAYPLGARFHVPHGHANALVMGPVLRFNLRAATPLYAELAPCVLPGRAFASDAEAAAAFVAAMEAMAGWGGLATRMSHFGVTAADIPSMADEVVTQIQRLIATNPCDMGFEDVCAIYRAVL